MTAVSPGPWRAAVTVLRGVAALLALSVSTVVLTLAIFTLGLLKFAVPGETARDGIRRWLAAIAETWVAFNSAALRRYRDTRWDVELPPGLDRGGCYLVLCNHQSWADIPVLQRCFNRRLPMLRFFLKRQLIWVPFLGAAWWALDFPFMRRATRQQLARRPALRGRDLESARRACEKFRRIPVAIMNFAEGTRFRPAKRTPGSRYRHVLPPRIGGLAQVLHALAEPLDGLIDVTIVYSKPKAGDTAPTLWHLVSGQVRRITVRAQYREIPARLRGRDFRDDPELRRELKAWVEGLWAEKDRLIGRLQPVVA